MSNVTLGIGGRGYTVACAAGEEEHLTMLGRAVDEKIAGMAGGAGQSETRMLLFAALLLADEVHDRNQLAAAHAPNRDARLDAIAERLENLAHQLEAAPQDA